MLTKLIEGQKNSEVAETLRRMNEALNAGRYDEAREINQEMVEKHQVSLGVVSMHMFKDAQFALVATELSAASSARVPSDDDFEPIENAEDDREQT